MSVDAPPPRPGDPDGTLRDRVTFVAGLLLWIGAISIISIVGWAYRNYRSVVGWVRNRAD